MRKPLSLDDALEQARYLAGNFARKVPVERDDLEQVASIAAWRWWDGERRVSLYTIVRNAMVDEARKVKPPT